MLTDISIALYEFKRFATVRADRYLKGFPEELCRRATHVGERAKTKQLLGQRIQQ